MIPFITKKSGAYLQAVADAQNRNTKKENIRIRMRGIFVIDGIWRAR